MGQPMTADKKTRRRLNRKLQPAGMRVCGTCFAVKSVSQFSRNGDGYKSTCKECRAAEDAKWREANPGYKAKWHAEHREEQREYNADYYAANSTRTLDIGDAHLDKRCAPETSGGCGQLKTRGDFHRQRREWDQRQPLCRECNARKNANSGYRKTCRQAHGEPETTQCHLCGLPNDATAWVDHLVPQSKAATITFADIHAAHNLRWVHAECNIRKRDGATTYEQFRRIVPDIFPLSLRHAA